MRNTKGAIVKRKLGFAATAGALAVALLLALSACGESDDSDGVASLTDTTGQSQAEGGQGSGGNSSGAASAEEWERAQLAYARCMREHGVDFPDPVNGRFRFRADRADQQKVAAAQQACRHILQDAAPPVDEEQQAEEREAALAFARCMREHGVDVPDPQFQQGGGELQLMPQGSEDDPNYEEAKDACQPILNAAQPDGQSAEGEGS
jgi:hypothetical protein